MRTLLVGLGGLLLLATATTGPAQADGAIPLRVGQVSLAENGASWRPNGGDWADAIVNLPVATGTALRTGDNGAAEFRVGDAVVALAGGTETDLARLDPHLVKVTLPRGRIGVAVRTLADDDSIEIDVPNGTVHLLQPGRYDIAAGTETSPARVAVFDGSAELAGGDAATTVPAGFAARIGGTGPAASKLEPAEADQFDTGLQARTEADDTMAGRLHLSPELAGVSALDRAGEWRAIPEYGAAWFPEGTAGGWAPYRDGSWRWIPPWGWTWIDNADWGFAPSHYGRWVQVDGRWGWVPGKPGAEPAYAPAVVAFLGTPGVGLSYADAFGPAVAWFPLAPGEVYWPGFTRDIGLIRRLNDGEVADASAIRLADNGGPPPAIVTAEYRNRRFATAMPRNAFVAGHRVGEALLAIPERRLQWAPLILAGAFPPAPAPRPVAVAAAPAKAKPAKPAAPTKRAAVIAAAKAAVPVLATAHKQARILVRHAAPVRLALRHAVERTHGTHPASRLRVLASATRTHAPHRRIAALHGRLR